MSESGSFVGTGVTYFGVDPDACFVYVNTYLVTDSSDRQEYTVSENT